MANRIYDVLGGLYNKLTHLDAKKHETKRQSTTRCLYLLMRSYDEDKNTVTVCIAEVLSAEDVRNEMVMFEKRIGDKPKTMSFHDSEAEALAAKDTKSENSSG